MRRKSSRKDGRPLVRLCRPFWVVCLAARGRCVWNLVVFGHARCLAVFGVCRPGCVRCMSGVQQYLVCAGPGIRTGRAPYFSVWGSRPLRKRFFSSLKLKGISG